jgi:hypothetical protein
MALCPNCKMEVGSDNIESERIGSGPFKPVTTMFSCPNCHVVIGIAQFTTW